MWKKSKNLKPRARLALTGLGFILIAFIGVTDFLTGYELAFSIFYLFPIILIAWTNNLTMGIIAAAAAAGAWLAADMVNHPPYSHFLIPYWNSFVRFCFFMIIVYLFSSLKNALEREESLSKTDSLTGALNPRAFMDTAEREVERIRRTQSPLSLVYIDADNFKEVNDTLGHTTGDSVLRFIVDVLTSNLRGIDVVARMGGDEFAILMPDTDEAGAMTIMKRVCGELLDLMRRNRWPVTFSVGIAAFELPPRSAEEMIKNADVLMYKVKNDGKNNIASAVF